jgi:hypothetical protein
MVTSVITNDYAALPHLVWKRKIKHLVWETGQKTWWFNRSLAMDSADIFILNKLTGDIWAMVIEPDR